MIQNYKTIEGPWYNEPDFLDWVDEETQYPCYIIRHPAFGCLLGYVRLSKEHPLFGKDLSSYDSKYDIDVHGGVSHANEKFPGCSLPQITLNHDEGYWYIGFDCAHAGDVAPALDLAPGGYNNYPYGTYKDVNFVKNECKKLAAQLKSFEIKDNYK